jgi:dTDP-4-amino-4,6-dideoxygalactose transaminase
VNVPLLDLRPQYASIRFDVQAAIDRVCEAQQFILGAEVEELERELAATTGAAFAVGLSSGTDALLVSLMALDVGSGDEVIVPAFSFFATAGSVARLGARPVFVDVDPDTLMITADGIRSAVTPRTRAIIPVHLYGLCAEMGTIAAVASAAGVPLVEDAAQAIGAAWRGQPAGSLGRVACFSFFPSKNLGAFGDAGLATTSDRALAERIRGLRNHGAEQKYYHREIGGNFRLDALQAAILRAKLPHLASWNARRRANAAVYAGLFADAGLTGRVRLPAAPDDRVHTYHQYVIRVTRRDALRAHLAARGVGTEVYYPVPLHRQECFAAAGPVPTLPNADAAAAEVLALPIYPELTQEQQAYVVDCIAEFFR